MAAARDAQASVADVPVLAAELRTVLDAVEAGQLTLAASTLEYGGVRAWVEAVLGSRGVIVGSWDGWRGGSSPGEGPPRCLVTDIPNEPTLWDDSGGEWLPWRYDSR
jgi:hypothetical protein